MSIQINLMCGEDCDNTADIQAAVDAADPGSVLEFAPMPTAAPFRISRSIVLSKPVTIRGERTVVKQLTPGLQAFDVAADDVTISNLIIQGAGAPGLEIGIRCLGQSKNSPRRRLKVSNCQLSNWGMYGLYLKWLEDFEVTSCKITSTYYAAIMCLSVADGYIGQNTIDGVAGLVSNKNGYGVALTRNSAAAGELETDPVSRDVTVEGNKISNIPTWQALDTHAGKRILFLGNRISKCWRGIAVGDCPNALGTPAYAPKDCVVADNVIDSGVTDGTAAYGINVNGAANLADYAEGCIVRGNTVRGYGVASAGSGIAVYCYATRGLVVQGNTIIEPGKDGFGFAFNNFGFTLTGNTITDAWSATQQTAAIHFINDFNRGTVGNNSHLRGSKVATNVNNVGMNVAATTATTNNWIAYTKDYSEAALAIAGPANVH